MAQIFDSGINRKLKSRIRRYMIIVLLALIPLNDSFGIGFVTLGAMKECPQIMLLNVIIVALN